jgi:hypothetical protein
MPPFYFADYTSESVGVDETGGRFGEVSLERCKLCGVIWLRYFVEYEAITASGRWFRAPIPANVAARLEPVLAIPLLESLPWYYQGGSFFRSLGSRTSGTVRVGP